VLRLLRVVASAGRRARMDLAVCGEMAADPLLVALLVGLGFRAFSMTPAAIPAAKRSLAALDSKVAARVARQAVRAASADDVYAMLVPLAERLHRAATAPGDGATGAQTR
jgi:signal transduction protein with GAF and PtsI domain